MISPLGNFPMRFLGHSDAQGWLRSQVNWTLDEHLQKFFHIFFTFFHIFSHCCGVFNMYKPAACRLVLVLCLCEGLDTESYTLRLRGVGTRCWSVLCCAVCAVLICAVLCCAVLCCFVLCRFVLCWSVLFCAVLFCAVLHWTIPCCTTVPSGSAVLCCTVLCCAAGCHTVLWRGGGGGYCVFRVNCVAVTSLVLTCV